MQIPLYQVDAFTDRVFHGNPAAVCPLDTWLTRQQMLAIAAENNLAETAFFVKTDDYYEIRWFTPEIEMDLCGHATLASAHVIFTALAPDLQTIHFESKSGPLHVTRNNGMLTLDFPARVPVSAIAPRVILEAMSSLPLQVLKARDYILVYADEDTVVNMKPDAALLNTINIDPGGVIITAPGKTVDFVSRFFTPQASIFEDPVTGSAHCSLIPYWAGRLRKDTLRAKQVSPRGGDLLCQLQHDRVLISGNAVTYLEGVIWLNI